MISHRLGLCMLLITVALSTGPARSALAVSPGPHVPPSGDVGGTVADSASGTPLSGGEIRVMQGGNVVATAVTDPFGRYLIHNLPAGSYRVEVRYLGYRSATVDLPVGATEAVSRADFRLVTLPISLSAIEVTTTIPLAVDTRSGNQIFKQNDYHGAPTNTTSQILQQAIVGAVRAPTGEVHIRGQHAEYTYYVDGVPVPAGISGSLNELFDPQVVNQISFQTGGWDAEYGNKNTAIINVTTRIPSGGFHFDVSGYAGMFASAQSGVPHSLDGQGLVLSTNAGKWGLFFSGARQASDMRQEPVVFDTARQVIENFHNDGTDVFGFAKAQFTASDRDILTLDLNRSRTHFATPFDSGAGVIDDHQQDVNGFINLGWRHHFTDVAASVEGTRSELFAGAFFRDGSLTYTAGVNDQPSFVFYPDTTHYNVSEDRNFHVIGLKLDYTLEPRHGLQFKTGTLVSVTGGHENFATSAPTTAGGTKTGPTSNSDLNGSDVGVYAQGALAPSDYWELRTGLRFDNHHAPFAGDRNQVSPRVKLSFFPDPGNTFWLYYGRLFVPTNVEDLRAITGTAQGGVATSPTLPERDHFFEAGYVHRFPVGVVTKLSAYYKQSDPGVDDNTVPNTAIVTAVNVEHIRVTGLESVVEVRPSGPLSGYLNLALNHAYGYGAITGGYFAFQPPTTRHDLDHDQRLSAAGSVVYSQSGFYASTTGIYGSGLISAVSADSNPTYSTGLFAFNKVNHVPPNFILNASAGYTFVAGGAVFRPQLYVDNVFNNQYLLKGAFFSGAWVGRPRSAQLRLDVGI